MIKGYNVLMITGHIDKEASRLLRRQYSWGGTLERRISTRSAPHLYIRQRERGGRQTMSKQVVS